ncbi:MAG: hypothetical protein C4K49_07685 [Candidatus Thorarchaeota archaeon]|nr:MAG: hypothetical protein C4K49_07685 [Candidatus Thorarchaeota archaeon]
MDATAYAILNMAFVESAAYHAFVLAAGCVPWATVDYLVVGFVVSGVIQMIVGFAIIVYGFMLGMGLF